jgi:hypothetical protein
VVNVTAQAEGGWRFQEWSGAAGGTNPSASVEMAGDKTVTGHFNQRHSVATQFEEGEVTPEFGTWDHGTAVSFRWEERYHSSPDFSHWSGLPEDPFPNGPFGPGTASSNPVNVTVQR